MRFGIGRIERHCTFSGFGGDTSILFWFDVEAGQHRMRMVQFHPSAGQRRVQLDSAAEQSDGFLDVSAIDLFQLLGTEEVEFVRVEVAGRFAVRRYPACLLDQAGAATKPVGDLLRR
ncbi:MAG: hypothetical protein E5X67_13810 [Mesorhizobium sp.]|uniref:hypothetical protein n=1 Tax=Mesorhizobium sp. TaxID=1871066 RepID=UPI0012239777|nr:hypothetical protein [Mesorhizobium sp.]TIP27834.1 MAG: hypothetical protein E5X67_13810 [Mesorhizobium sp.]